jgi:ABC-type branched-subunit amino acid transport system ATPase component
MIEVKNLTKSFGGVKAVDDISFSIRKGEIAGIIGPNGAGKSTLFASMAGASPPNSGEIFLADEKVTGKRPDQLYAKGLMRTFQIPRPFANMSVLENVMVAGQNQTGEYFYRNWWSRRAIDQEKRNLTERAFESLRFVTLEGMAHSPAGTLSGGQQKLLELARVLIASPRVILLDEPAAGVNPALLEILIEKIVALNRQGITFLIVEHNMDLVMEICETVLCMMQGRLLTQGTPQQVCSDARVVEAYLGDAVPQG